MNASPAAASENPASWLCHLTQTFNWSYDHHTLLPELMKFLNWFKPLNV